MTAVFLHGVPETPRVWDDLRAQLSVPSVALRLPGFGVPWPPGFSADKDGYADWLTAELSVGRQIARGVPAGVAAEMAAHHDETMSRSILGLYRSAAPNVSADWGADIDGPAAAPGMVVIPTADTFDDEALSRQMAGRLGAQVAVLDGGTHWWMFDPTATVAGILEDFWK